MVASRIHDFSYGHTVYGHEGKCANLHGHNGRVHFGVESLFGSEDNVGRVIDFSVIKSQLCDWIENFWDHRFLVYEYDHRAALLKAIDATVVCVPFNPTAENMAKYLVEVVGPKVLAGLGVRLVQCTMEETRKCSATYMGSSK